MRSWIRFESGEIVLVPFPFTDLSEIRDAPVLILSNLDSDATTHFGYKRKFIKTSPKEYLPFERFTGSLRADF